MTHSEYLYVFRKLDSQKSAHAANAKLLTLGDSARLGIPIFKYTFVNFSFSEKVSFEQCGDMQPP